MNKIPTFLLLLSTCLITTVSAGEGKHLFILSGQSNMAGLKPETTFIPAVKKALGQDRVIVVKDAKSGRPIILWIKKEGDEKSAVLYTSLMEKVKKATEGGEIASVTFIWMQGERDAREKWASEYEDRLLTLFKQVKDDLDIQELNVVIGRISDFDIGSEKYGDWDKIREIQVKVAESRPRTAWVNTDDLNDKVKDGKKVDDLHMTSEGYDEMGRRFAEAALNLLESNP